MKFFSFISVFLISFHIWAGSITCSVGSLFNFGNVYPFHSSTSQRYIVSGTALTANLLVTANNGYEVSLTYTHGYSRSITLVPVSGSIANTTIFVRFSPSSIGSVSGNIINSSVGSATQNVAVSGTCIAWAIPASYYSTINTQRGAALKTALYTKISTGTTALSYTPGVWNAFATTDIQPNGKIWDIYSTRFDINSPYEYTLSTDQCGSYSVEGDCYNREHTFPQSWFNSVSPMTTDVHHVMASDGKVNGERNNWPFGNVTSVSYTSSYGGKRGTGTTNFGYTGTVFEPINEYKGDIARAQLYMATRYENVITGWQSNGNANDVLAGNSFPAYDNWYIELLISWHNLDPVSDKEIKRNNAIYNLQNNRNPFVDSPQFVRKIWGGSIPSEPTINASNLTITNVNNTSVTLNWTSGNGQRRIVLVRAINAINALPVDTFQYTANSNINSAMQIGSGNFIVYNGTGSSVTITNLAQGTLYHYAVIEYNGWYTSTNYLTSSYLTSSSTTLPVTWLSFDARLIDNKINLLWRTANELNNDLFEVERSENGIEFEKIGTVKGNGNTLSVSTYLFVDDYLQQAEKAILYYRIRQIDYDGTFSFSDIKTINLHSSTNLKSIKLSPNPVYDMTTLGGLAANDIYMVNIYTSDGILVLMQNNITASSANINCGHLQSGLYFIEICNLSTSDKIIKKLLKK